MLGITIAELCRQRDTVRRPRVREAAWLSIGCPTTEGKPQSTKGTVMDPAASIPQAWRPKFHQTLSADLERGHLFDGRWLVFVHGVSHIVLPLHWTFFWGEWFQAMP